MAKLLKPLVVIVLLVSIAALVIQATVLFPKRTLIKDRTQKLENGMNRVVSTLRGSLSEDIQQAVPFAISNLRVDKTADIGRMDAELNRAHSVAQAVLQGWEDTKTDLENTRLDLENTRNELEITRNQLEDARTQIVQLNETIRAKDQELIEQSNLIASLEEEKSSLEMQLANLNEELDALRDQVAGLEEEKNALELILAQYDKEADSTTNMAVGTTAKIVYLNPDWNFVIIDIGEASGAKVGAEMIIHRGDQMLGKIQLSRVLDNVSIAEVLPDFQKDSIQEGDDVLF
ncbi:MAG: hypothetical protein LBN38_07390 [Verrucomicrobiota bacterium]|jgi:DNA gyrase/topoisomerase IV subunit A|nr:hypothetical protein [Verrucomicrobiota bacterium]